MRRSTLALVLGAALVALLGGCGSANPPSGAKTSSSASPSASQSAPNSSPTPTPAATYIVLLEPGATTVYPSRDQPARVAIVDRSGREIAGFDFNMGWPPLICGAGYVRPPIVRLVNHAVYFVDHVGVIRELQLNGAVSEVTRLPITSTQQQPYFAISPDGAKVMASIVKMLDVNPKSTNLGDCLLPNSSQGVENYFADRGQTPHDLGPAEFGQGQATVVAGWDADGPLATTQTYLGVQNTAPVEHFAGKSLVHIDPSTGKVVGSALGGSDCQPVDRLDSGTLLCYVTNYDLAVRTPGGTTLWSVTPPKDFAWGFTPQLSPDGNHVALQGVILGRDGTVASEARINPASSGGYPYFVPQGWFDAWTVVGGDPNKPTQLELLSLATPATATPFPVAGTFVGTLAAG